ncbi:MAG TPA: hypothetical protein VLA17_08010, partial [Candidatus Limnocylindria bacterium]|nr:hypothetical protein [Candidatus Limnocylindria bacterium]
ELRAAQTKVDTIRGHIETKLTELQFQLTERQLLADSRAAEIHDLKGEIGRLLEQAAARESAAEVIRTRLNNEDETARAAHQAEIAALREEHGDLQRRLEEQIAVLLGEIQELQRRAADHETEIQSRAREMAAAITESAALRERAQEMEKQRLAENAAAESAVEQARRQWEAERESLHHELQQKNWALAQQQSSVENLALTHRNQIQKLEEKLAEQQRGFQDRNSEVERAQSQAQSLQRRIEELEIELQHGQLTAARGAEQVREQYAARIDELSAQLQRQAAALEERETALYQPEQSLRAEMDRLVREAQEKNLILQNRNDELVRAKSERDTLQENYNELVAATARNETAMSADAMHMRAEFQAQLALLQAELSQKEWALEEQRAAASGMDQQYREQIESLRRQMAQTKSRGQEQPDQFVIGDEALTDERKERHRKYREVMDMVTSSTDPSFPASENRRWRSRFGWKRRWK